MRKERGAFWFVAVALEFSFFILAHKDFLKEGIYTNIHWGVRDFESLSILTKLEELNQLNYTSLAIKFLF